MKEISYVMIKPGFLQHESEIVKRLETVGTITKRQKMLLNDNILAAHYAEHVGKGFYAELVNYMKSGEVIGYQVEGEEGLKHIDEYADGNTERGKAMRKTICDKFKFASLGFQTIDGVIKAIGIEPCKLCTYCWNGKE